MRKVEGERSAETIQKEQAQKEKQDMGEQLKTLQAGQEAEKGSLQKEMEQLRGKVKALQEELERAKKV